MSSVLGDTAASTMAAVLEKAPTGITGFDQITNGGVPRGRPTLVAGAAGSGKTLFGIEFLVRGITQYDEPGVLIAFEETARDLATNVASLGHDLNKLEAEGKLVVDAVHLDPSEIIESGEFDLDGLFIRLASAVAEVGAKRIVLDTLELLFSAIPNEAVLRGELGRLFRWIKDQGLTAVITGERGGAGASLTRFGIEEYVSDCVVVLDHRVTENISTRRMRVAKYRGSLHGTNEYPFLITDRGLVVLPVTSMGLEYAVADERISTGIPRLDEMLTGGIYRGSSVMLSGTAGTGKTSISASMAAATCAAGERALFFSLEESPGELIRNMRSIGIDLQRWVDEGLLILHSVRATAVGLEEHISMLHRLLEEHEPSLVVLDAVASLGRTGTAGDTASVVARDLDLLKSRGITGVITTLSESTTTESSEVNASSLVDTWLLLRNVESNGERNRLLFIIKSRGSAHSNQVREFRLTAEGPQLIDVYVGADGVLTGSARIEQIAQDEEDRKAHAAEAARRREALTEKTTAAEAQIAALRAQLATDRAELERFEDEDDAGRASGAALRADQAQSRSTTVQALGEEHSEQS